MMDRFFDLLNIKIDIEHTISIKEFLTPFTSPNDKRFKWLINDFLSYFERWQEGNFTTADKKKMFLSHQTYTCILINVHSIIEMVLGMTQITIIVTMTMVLTGRVSQDPTEENFGRPRAARRRNEHPSLYQFGYGSNMIRMSRSVAPVTGNLAKEPLPNRRK